MRDNVMKEKIMRHNLIREEIRREKVKRKKLMQIKIRNRIRRVKQRDDGKSEEIRESDEIKIK